MVYGGAGSGKMVLTSSSSPGVSLKQEGISRRGFCAGRTTFSIICPITPSARMIAGLRYLNARSEVLETLAELKPWETTGMVVLQAESEVAAINMVYGGAGSGKIFPSFARSHRRRG